MPMFEVAIFNREVKELVKNHEHHKHLDDVWGDLNYMEVSARDEDDAKAKLYKRYPESKGFEITQVVQFLD